jgi:hypothetical protein
MTPRTAKRLVLPAALFVTTFVSASSCTNLNKEDCADIEKQSDCDSQDGCGWNTEFGWCSSTCHLEQTQAECEAIDRCVWFAGGSGTDTGGTETGGGGSCEPPFT